MTAFLERKLRGVCEFFSISTCIIIVVFAMSGDDLGIVTYYFGFYVSVQL